MPTPHFRVGDRFDRYVVERTLGHGGMGAVYLATDTRLNRPVALKLPFVDAAGDPRGIERFLREAEAAAQLRHPNICPVYDVGKVEDQYFIALAYIEGRPLNAIVRDESPLATEFVATLMWKLANALQTAHDASLLHRDLKPSNVVVEENGEPVLMDFGLAFFADRSGPGLTSAGARLGTPAYMAPELFEVDVRASVRSDVYAMGVMLYELLCGRVPYDAPSLRALVGQIVMARPRRPSSLRDDLQPELEEVCLRAMHAESEERFGSALEFANAIAPFAAVHVNVAPLGPTIEMRPPSADDSSADGSSATPYGQRETQGDETPVRSSSDSNSENETLSWSGSSSNTLGGQGSDRSRHPELLPLLLRVRRERSRGVVVVLMQVFSSLWGGLGLLSLTVNLFSYVRTVGDFFGLTVVAVGIFGVPAAGLYFLARRLRRSRLERARILAERITKRFPLEIDDLGGLDALLDPPRLALLIEDVESESSSTRA